MLGKERRERERERDRGRERGGERIRWWMELEKVVVNNELGKLSKKYDIFQRQT